MSDIEIGGRLFLAPLAGFTDIVFRDICSGLGADYCTTEMISAKAVMMKSAKTLKLARVGKCRTGIQLFGSDEDAIGYACTLFSSDRAPEICGAMPAFIDINMGCPVHKVVANGEGSALMRDPAKAEKVLKAAVKASELPVSVKIRAGYSGSDMNAPEIARIAEACGVSFITVHGRTREQFYSGTVNKKIIADTVKAVSVPVIGNGDVKNAETAGEMISETGCAAVMIGRAALGNPWIFSEIKADMDGRKFDPPSGDEKIDMAREQLRRMVGEKGAACAVGEARKHLAAYISGFPGAAEARGKINIISDPEKIDSLLEDLKNRK